MSDFEFELNLPGLNELMKSPDMQAHLEVASARVADIAGKGFGHRVGVATFTAIGNVFAENRIITDNTTYSGSSPIVLVDGDLTISNGIVLTITNSATLIVNGDLHIRNKGEILVSNNALVMIKGIVIQENGQATLDNTSFFACGGYVGIHNKTTLPNRDSDTYIDGNDNYENSDVLAGIVSNLIERTDRENIQFTMPAYVTAVLGGTDESITPLPIELTYFIARQTSESDRRTLQQTYNRIRRLIRSAFCCRRIPWSDF